jgi:hypothetical protein
MRTFNLAGPCIPARHYIVPPLERLPKALPLVRRGEYLSLSGPRQSGKTSVLTALRDAVHAEGWGRVAVLSCEAASQRSEVHDTPTAEAILVRSWWTVLTTDLPEVRWPTPDEIGAGGVGLMLGAALKRWAIASDKPLVLVIDEVDGLARGPFISLLSQLRADFHRRGDKFPHSVVLAGMRSLRDNDVALGGDGRGSPFNIVYEFSLGNFSRAELERLYAQHTNDTGQRFETGAVDLVEDQTRGQPWLVNAIASHCVDDLVPDRTHPIGAANVAEAIRRLEASNAKHFASLAARLAEERVMRVVAPVVAGDVPNVSSDDERYVMELGILDRLPGERLGPANPIYARALVRRMTEVQRKSLATWSPAWLDAAGRIDPVKLRENFLTFWALHRDMMKDRISYPEAVAHFGLMTYLDRVANGGGRVDREFAVGRGRLDLLLSYGDLKLPIEVKVHRDLGGDPVPDGVDQLDRYCEGLRVAEGWLVVFDQRKAATGTRLELEEVVTAGGRRLSVIRA